MGPISSLAFERESDLELGGEGWSSGAQKPSSPSSLTLSSASARTWFGALAPVWYEPVHPIGSTGIMNFKFGYSKSLRGSLVTETNSRVGCVIGGEEREGVGGGGEVSGILARI